MSTTTTTTAPAGPKADPTRYEPALVSMPPRLVQLKREIVYGHLDPDSPQVRSSFSNLKSFLAKLTSASISTPTGRTCAGESARRKPYKGMERSPRCTGRVDERDRAGRERRTFSYPSPHLFGLLICRTSHRSSPLSPSPTSPTSTPHPSHPSRQSAPAEPS